MRAEPSGEGCVRTVSIGYLPSKSLKQVVYHPFPLETKEVAVQRLVLIVPVEEQVHDKQAAEDEPDAYISHYAELR